MPSGAPEKFAEIKKTAIQEAENKTKPLEQYAQGQIPEVLDSPEELDFFFETAHALINKYVDETKDPLLIAKKQELETVYQNQKAKGKKYYSDQEEVADEYWKSLLTIMEKEERQALKHGLDLLKDLGIANTCKLIDYRKIQDKEGKETHCYEIEKDHLEYRLYFQPDGRIEIFTSAYSWPSKYLSMYRNKTVHYTNDARQILERNTSLAELKDLSAFKIFLSPILSLELTDPIATISRSLGNLPKRSTNPALQPLLEFRDELSKISDEISALVSTQRLDLTPEQYNHYMTKISECFRKRLRQYFDAPDKTDPKAEELKNVLINLVVEYPHLIDSALEEAKTVEELQLFSFDEHDNEYLYAKVECKRDTLPKPDATKTAKELTKYNLSPKHIETVLYLRQHGFIQEADFPGFIPILKLIPQELLNEDGYIEFITDHPDWFSKKETLTLFTSYAKGLSKWQFRYYTNYWKNNENPRFEYRLESLNSVLKAQKNAEDLQLAFLLFNSGERKINEIKKLIARIKVLAKKKKNGASIVEYYLRESTKWSPDMILTALETLNNDYIEDANNSPYLSELTSFSAFLPSYILKPLHFKKINSLKPFQRKGLRERIGSLNVYTEESLNRLLDILSQVESEPEMLFMLPRLGEERKSMEEFSEIAMKAAKHRRIWEAISKTQEITKKTFPQKAHEIIELMIDRNFTEQMIINMIPYLNEIETDIQKSTIVLLITPENAEELIKEMSLCGKQCRDIDYGYDSNLEKIYYKALSQKPPISDILTLIQRLAATRHNKNSLINRNTVALIMTQKTTNYKELLETVDLMENPQFIAEFEKVIKSEEFQKQGDMSDLAEIYFLLAVSPSDFKDAEKTMEGLKNFLVKAVEEKYSQRTDPDFNRALSLLDPVKLLEKENSAYPHITFILNILQNSSPEFSKEKLAKTALKFLESPKEKLQEKGAKLLIGLGTITQTLNQGTITEIAKKGVDNKLTKFTLSDKVTPEQLSFLQQKESPQIPLSLYFSFLITLEQASKSKNQPAFESLVKRYKDIENENVYTGNVLILSHNPADTTHSYLFAQDNFNPEAHTVLAKEVQGLPVETLRHGKDNESVESMFSKLETAKGDLTLVVGGHGGFNSISFGSESFSINELFERLKKRVKQQKEGPKWTTTIIFESCHSDYNIKILSKLWLEDAETKDFPIKMLSSSNEESSSAKMASDNWALKAKEAKTTGKPLTWAEFYGDIESKNFIMSDDTMKSNSTLFINGEELGALEKPREATRETAA